MALASKRFPALLKSYADEAARGDLWILTWYGLLYSYFNFDLETGNDSAPREGWETLRSFLEQTWPLIDRQAGTDLVPDWVKVLRHEADVLTATPVEKYSRAYLRNETESTDRLAADLGIPPSSWFWHALVLGAVRSATGESDAEFRRLVPQLIKLIETKPGFRDEAIEIILNRYHTCSESPPNEQLSDFVCQPTVWKNPKLKVAGIAPAWNRVPDPVWQMVLSWVNERNLKDFFDILAARNNADEGRLAFWSKYLKQITWTRLVFGADTMSLKQSNAEVRNLIAREEGAYAQLTRFLDFDGFMMQIGPYIIIEFSKTGKACYGYQADRIPFKRDARRYDGGTEDLAAGYSQDRALRIHHSRGWESKAEQSLQKLGIFPDVTGSRRVSSPVTGSTATATNTGRAAERLETPTPGPDMAKLYSLVESFQGASIDDKRRTSSGGRLWVEDPLQRVQLASALRALGFRWANSRQAWYFPEG